MPKILPGILRNYLLASSRIRLLGVLALIALGTLSPEAARAWKSEGHNQVGRLALEAVDEQARSRLWHLLGTRDLAAVDEACNWPDEFEDRPEWEWAAPQHYVNISRADGQYERERDCPDGLCVTEAIKKYAGQLADPRLGAEKRWEAFAWLCHLVGDLHQPLHAGYLDDQGGNLIKISYQGEQINLHQFWDQVLIRERQARAEDWRQHITGDPEQDTGNIWNPSETDDWTSESHALMKRASYPPGDVIKTEFADQGWLLIQQQWLKAGERLAQILNATLGNGEVVLSGELASGADGVD